MTLGRIGPITTRFALIGPPMTPTATPPPTVFRAALHELEDVRGDRSEWPVILWELLASTFRCEQAIDRNYTGGGVFIDRDAHATIPSPDSERAAVYGLYRRCHGLGGTAGSSGCLTVGNEAYWLLGYEWPNQSSEAGRRADLVGLTTGGGLVVFECKKASNGLGPLGGAVQGLDYLACLTSAANFQRVRIGFDAWRDKPGREVPERFRGKAPDPLARHEVIVLGEPGYWGRYGRSGRGVGWEAFARVSGSGTPAVRFAMCDFESTRAEWVLAAAAGG